MASKTSDPPRTPPSAGISEISDSKSMGVARATGLMMVMVLLSRILGVLRDSIIAHYFGRTAATDAYNAAFTVPDLLFYLLQSGALSSTIVPIITEYRQQGKQRQADKTVSIVASVIFVVVGTLICVMWIFVRQLTVFLNPGFDQARIDMAVPLTRVLLPAQLCFFLGGLWMGVLYSRKQFLIPAAGPVIYNSGIILGGVVLHHWLGIKGLVVGAIVGAVIGNFLLPLIAVLRLGVRLHLSFAVLHPAAKKVWKMLLPIGLGVSLPNIDQMVNKGFASYLGSGETTAIMNAYRLMLLPIGVFAQSMALAVYPTLAGQAAEQNLKAMRGTMNQSLRNILFLTVPASALMFLLAAPIITFLLQSGKYSHADALRTAATLQCLSLGIFAWSCQGLLTRGFYALQNSKIPVISGAIVSVIFIGMNWFVVHKTNWGVCGLGVATSIAATIHMLALLFLLNYRLKGIQRSKLIVSILQTLTATVVLCIVTWLARTLLDRLGLGLHPKFYALLVIAASGGAGLWAYLGVARRLQMSEIEVALKMLRKITGAMEKIQETIVNNISMLRLAAKYWWRSRSRS